jgi:hypothetical protein
MGTHRTDRFVSSFESIGVGNLQLGIFGFEEGELGLIFFEFGPFLGANDDGP